VIKARCHDHARSSDVSHCLGSGETAAPEVRFWLAVAAAPTFAGMAIWTVLSDGPSQMLCMSSPDPWPFDGMAAMYILMTIFHAEPWISLVLGRRTRFQPPQFLESRHAGSDQLGGSS
jgi:hypothetical protein